MQLAVMKNSALPRSGRTFNGGRVWWKAVSPPSNPSLRYTIKLKWLRSPLSRTKQPS